MLAAAERGGDSVRIGDLVPVSATVKTLVAIAFVSSRSNLPAIARLSRQKIVVKFSFMPLVPAAPM